MRYASTPLYPGQEYLTNQGLVTLTEQDVEEIAKNTTRMIKSGVDVPVFGRHLDKGPITKDKEPEAHETRGWLIGAQVGKDGGLRLIYDIHDPEYIDAIKQKRIRKTSPDLVHNYTDGNKRNWGPIVRHLAMTPKPINNKQSDMEALAEVAFSECEGPIQFAEPSPGVKRMPTKKPEASKKEPEVKKDDIKKTEESYADDNQLHELFRAVGIEPPSSSPFENIKSWVEQLCTSLQTVVSQNVIKKAGPLNEEQLGVKAVDNLAYQFSEHPDPNVKQLAIQFSELKEKYEADRESRHKERRTAFTTSITERIEKSFMAEPVKAILRKKLGSLQFSEDDSEAPSMTVTEAIEAIEAAVPPASRVDLDAAQIEDPDAEFLKDEPPKPGDEVMLDSSKVDEIIKWEEGAEFKVPSFS